MKMWNVLPLLLTLLRVSECVSQIVGFRGQSITLPCLYDIQNLGAAKVCWGRGLVPINGCNSLILNTDGHKVSEQTRLSSRYQLLGRLDQGDVSLTILNLKDDDAGLYGCRVEKSGWYNDEKHHISLVINEGFTHSPATTSIILTTGSDASDVKLTEATPTQEKRSTAAQQDNYEYRIIKAVKLFFILLAVVTAVYGVWRWKHSAGNQSEEEIRSV